MRRRSSSFLELDARQKTIVRVCPAVVQMLVIVFCGYYLKVASYSCDVWVFVDCFQDFFEFLFFCLEDLSSLFCWESFYECVEHTCS